MVLSTARGAANNFGGASGDRLFLFAADSQKGVEFTATTCSALTLAQTTLTLYNACPYNLPQYFYADPANQLANGQPDLAKSPPVAGATLLSEQSSQFACSYLRFSAPPASGTYWLHLEGKALDEGGGEAQFELTFTCDEFPTPVPSPSPTHTPTRVPTPAPSRVPSPQPTAKATTLPPSPAPSRVPSPLPTGVPTPQPTHAPSAVPSPLPSARPTEQPTHVPSGLPSETPSEAPSEVRGGA